MIKDAPKTENSSRKRYQPPEVVRVTLRPEEAVLGHCKIPGAAGPASGSSTCSKFGLRCNSQGS